MSLNPPLAYSKSEQSLIEGFEGFSEVAYWDDLGKVWTGAYGHTKGVKEGDTYTREQGAELLSQDVLDVEDRINADSTYPLDQGEFDGLVDFAFELGIGALEGSTLWRLIMSGHPEEALGEFEKWDNAGGHPVHSILVRRQSDKAVFAVGLQEEQHGTEPISGGDTSQPVEDNAEQSSDSGRNDNSRAD